MSRRVVPLAHGLAAVIIPRCPMTRRACAAHEDPDRTCCRDTVEQPYAADCTTHPTTTR